jgi:hypothetical protein
MFRRQTKSTPVQSASRETPQSQALPPIEGRTVELRAIYEFGQLSTEELDRVKRAEELLGSLPAHIPPQHRKEVVEATLRAFGVSADKIVQAANKQLRALQTFSLASQEHAQQVLDDSAQRIVDLEAEIERCRQLQVQAETERDARAEGLMAEVKKIRQVADFFGEHGEGTRAASGEYDVTIEQDGEGRESQG